MNMKDLNPQNLKPRNNHVILHRSLAERKSLVMPQNSAEAWKWVVVAKAEGVKELNIGDQVWVSGKLGEDYAPIPNSDSLYIIADYCIMVVVGAGSENGYEQALED